MLLLGSESLIPSSEPGALSFPLDHIREMWSARSSLLQEFRPQNTTYRFREIDRVLRDDAAFPHLRGCLDKFWRATFSPKSSEREATTIGATHLCVFFSPPP